MRKQTLRIAIAFSLNLLTLSLFSAEAPSSYIDRFKDLAIEEMMRSGIPASITLAQAIHESGWGNAKLAKNSNNYFGIKCKDYWTGSTYYAEDDDYIDGKLIKSCFRAYRDISESFIDHSNFLKDNPRYRSLFQYPITDYKSWAKGLKECGYATDPIYATKLIRTIEKYQLYRFDQDAPQIQAAALAAPNFNIPQEFVLADAPVHETVSPITPDEPFLVADGPEIEVPAAYELPDDYERSSNGFESWFAEGVVVEETPVTVTAEQPETIQPTLQEVLEVEVGEPVEMDYEEAIEVENPIVQLDVAPEVVTYDLPVVVQEPPAQHLPAPAPKRQETIMRMNYNNGSSVQLSRKPRVKHFQRR